MQKQLRLFVTFVLGSELENQEKIALLQPMCEDGIPGFLMALENGHAETVADFVTLVLDSELENEETVIQLQAVYRYGTSELRMALLPHLIIVSNTCRMIALSASRVRPYMSKVDSRKIAYQVRE